jgi:uncharacterized protein
VPPAERFTVHAVRSTVVTFRDAMVAHAAGINRLNVYPVPDGDTGTNMARTLQAVVAEVEAAPDDDLAATCQAISHGSLMGARGNSGVILSQILRGLAGVLKDGDGSASSVAGALAAASQGAYKAVLKPIEGTILTVVREASEGAAAAAAGGADLLGVLEAARTAGQDALDRTPEMLPVLKDAGVVDAGGAGFMLLLDAALHVVDGRPLPEPTVFDGPVGETFEAVAHRGEGDISDLRYEVMYFLDLEDQRIEEFKQAWGEIGDSIVVVGGDGLWNCHVHTNDIGAALEAALDCSGRPHKIRVTDLFEEVAEEHALREAAIHGAPVLVRPGPAAAGLAPVTTAIVAVCSGDGLAELFWQLGVQGIVTGGQTLNPSTAELLDAVEHVNANQVVLLPNNKNIIPVAEQVDALTTKTVVVVPTRSMPEALAALVIYDPEASAGDNASEMAEAAEAVATGEVTQAVRDTASDAGPITTGDWIGIVRGDGIVSVAGTLEGASTALLDQLITPGRELLTIVTGLEAPRDTTDALQAWLAEQHEGMQVEVHYGGQALYPYLFGVE